MTQPVYPQVKNHPNLPSPRGVVLEVLRLAQSDDTGLNEIARVIETDPALAGRLLKVVNSAALNPGHSIASIRQAAAMLGLRAVTHLALAFTLLEDYRKGAGPLDLSTYWSSSLGRAAAMRRLAMRLADCGPEEAFTCGLLSGIGWLALVCVFPERYPLRDVAPENETFATHLERERRVLGIDHVALTAELMDDWHLPPTFAAAVRFLPGGPGGDGGKGKGAAGYGPMLRVAFDVADVLVSKTVGQEFLTVLMHRAQALGIEPLDFIEMFDQIGEDWRTAGRIFAVQTRNTLSLPELYALAQRRQQGLVDRDSRISAESGAGGQLAGAGLR